MSPDDTATAGIDFDDEATPEEVLEEFDDDRTSDLPDQQPIADPDPTHFDGFVADTTVERVEPPESEETTVLEDRSAEALFGD